MYRSAVARRMAAGLRRSPLQQVPDAASHDPFARPPAARSFMAYRLDAIRAAFDQVAQLVDGVVDAGMVQAGRVVPDSGK